MRSVNGVTFTCPTRTETKRGPARVILKAATPSRLFEIRDSYRARDKQLYKFEWHFRHLQAALLTIPQHVVINSLGRELTAVCGGYLTQFTWVQFNVLRVNT